MTKRGPNPHVRFKGDLGDRLRRVVERMREEGEEIDGQKPSANAFILDATRKELDAREAATSTTVNLKGDALLAYRAIAVAPAPMVIKTSRREILFGNLEYLIVTDKSQSEIYNKTAEDLGVILPWEVDAIDKDMKTVLRTRKPLSCLEFAATVTRSSKNDVHEKQPTKVPFIAHRFVFEVNGVDYLGDASFDCTQMVEHHYPSPPNLHQEAQQRAIVFPGAEPLLLDFFNKMPTACAVKNLKGELQLYNDEYLRLTGQKCPRREKPLEFLRGKTAQKLWNLPSTHAVVANDLRVGRANEWMYAYEVMNDKIGPRVSLRFPIPGSDGRIAHTGVISTTAGRQRYRGTIPLDPGDAIAPD